MIRIRLPARPEALRRGDDLAVGREVDGDGPALRRTDLLCSPVPLAADDGHGRRRRGGGQPLAGGVESQVAGALQPRQALLQALPFNVPDLDPSPAGDRQQAAVGREGQCRGPVGFLAQDRHPLAREVAQVQATSDDHQVAPRMEGEDAARRCVGRRPAPPGEAWAVEGAQHLALGVQDADGRPLAVAGENREPVVAAEAGREDRCLGREGRQGPRPRCRLAGFEGQPTRRIRTRGHVQRQHGTGPPAGEGEGAGSPTAPLQPVDPRLGEAPEHPSVLEEDGQTPAVRREARQVGTAGQRTHPAVGRSPSQNILPEMQLPKRDACFGWGVNCVTFG